MTQQKEGIWSLAKDEAMQKRRRATADPLRMRIVGLIGDSQGMTAKDLADRLRIEPNRLYYHLRILEDAGVIGVVDHRVVGKLAERVYGMVYRGRYIFDATDPADMAMNLSAILEITKVDAEEVLYEQARKVEAGEQPPVVIWGRLSFATTRDEIVEFEKRLDALRMEFRERATELHGDRGLFCTWVVYEQPADA